VDAFIVQKGPSKFDSINDYIDTNNDRFCFELFSKNSEQSLLPKRDIYEISNNINRDLNERRCLPIQKQCRFLCLNCNEINSEIDHKNFSCNLIKTTLKIAENRLTKKQKYILIKITQIEDKKTMSFLVRQFSKELNVGKSTVRVILQNLRDIGLINCGNSQTKGIPVKLTPVGDIIVNQLILNKNKTKVMKK